MIKLAAVLFFVLLAFAVAGAIDLAEDERLSAQGYVKERAATSNKERP